MVARRPVAKPEERTMVRGRQLAFAAAGFVLVGSLGLLSPGFVRPALADGAPVDNEDSRFSFYRAEDGFLRLDGTTGEVSICTRRPVGWLCQALPEDRAAFEAEIGRLERDKAALEHELLAHDLPLPAQMRPNPAADRQPRSQRPGEQEVHHVVSVIGEVWRRLVELIEGMQRDMLKKS
jgi:hypothetical protein